MRRLLAFISVVQVCRTVALAAPVDLVTTMPLSGAEWRIHEEAKGAASAVRLATGEISGPEWIAATVPGNIQSDLEAACKLLPISYGAGDPKLREVSGKDWWYRRDFTISTALTGRRLTLVFDGVDQQCEVWLNGVKVGANSGMFLGFTCDVSAAAKPGAVNRLAVRIARRVGETARNVPLRSATNIGWDWGTPVQTMGIWKDVRLEATGPARIDWTRVQTILSDDRASATVKISLEIDSVSDMSARAVLNVTGPGMPARAEVSVALHQGRNLVNAELPLTAPALWWPTGHGAQPLYRVSAELFSGRDASRMDARTTRFGVCALRWAPTEGAPADFINRFQLIVNGREIRTIGSNLVPADLYFGRMGPRALRLLRQAHAAGMNTLRLWGGGVIFHDDFYDLADELGVLLIQEFPLANHVPPTDAEYLATLETTARNIVRQVRNHPAIIEFDGGNEMRWKSDTDHPAFHLLKRVVAEEDGRVFRATCPDLGSTHGAWDFSLWTGHPSARFYDDLKASVDDHGRRISLTTMRAGEFGSASPANLEVWQREVPVQDQWPIMGLENEVLHRKRGVRAIGPFNWLQKAMQENEFGPQDSLAAFIQAGQFRGAEGLRYAMDALRRNGRRTAGMTTWDLNEPWPNVAGSYLIDFDGRPRMNLAFLQQAIAPLSLSLKYASVFYPLGSGPEMELFLTSDAAARAENLRWQWVARDRRGHVFARDEGRASIDSLDSRSLGVIHLRPPEATSFGPVFVELRLEDESGSLLTERLHIFAAANLQTPFANLVEGRGADPDDDPHAVTANADRPSDVANLIHRMPAHGMTPPPASVPPSYRELLAINDGYYGDDHAWSDGWFDARLRGKSQVGRFRFGRDRTGVLSDRVADYMKIETTLDGQEWQCVFEGDHLTQLPGFSAQRTVEVQIPPVGATRVRVTVAPPSGDAKVRFPVLDEFEVLPPEAGASITAARAIVLPAPPACRPLRRTTLGVESAPLRLDDGVEVLTLRLTNTGPMTAFPCEPHPLVAYRTDLFMENNHCFIPPGESRVITIRAKPHAESGLSLAQLGWRVSCWNADDAIVEPGSDVLLALGRGDRMSREFAGYASPGEITGTEHTSLQGRKPDTARLPYRLAHGGEARFDFTAVVRHAHTAVLVCLQTADQSADSAPQVEVTLNGAVLDGFLPAGCGVQARDPAHLACAAAHDFVFPPGVLRSGNNQLIVRIKNNAWFTWDALHCCVKASTPSQR